MGHVQEMATLPSVCCKLALLVNVGLSTTGGKWKLKISAKSKAFWACWPRRTVCEPDEFGVPPGTMAPSLQLTSGSMGSRFRAHTAGFVEAGGFRFGFRDRATLGACVGAFEAVSQCLGHRISLLPLGPARP